MALKQRLCPRNSPRIGTVLRDGAEYPVVDHTSEEVCVVIPLAFVSRGHTTLRPQLVWWDRFLCDQIDLHPQPAQTE